MVRFQLARLSRGPIAGLLAACSLLYGAGSARADFESGQLQLILAPGIEIETINQRYGTTTLESLPPLFLVAIPEGLTEAELELILDLDPDIIEAEFAFRNETPESIRQMVVAALGGTLDDYVDQRVVTRLQLADIHEHTLGENVVVAVLDTGVLASHPALAGSIEPGGWDFIDNDGDPTDAANGVDDDLDGQTDEGAGHGTMVAGIVHLVAPGARILPIRVLDDEGRGDSFHVAAGIRWAVEQGADVINLSLGLEESASIINHELRAAALLGVVLVSAVGNDSDDDLLYPARDSDVLGVTALDSTDVKADFSNYDDDTALAAPGIGILAPYHDGQYAVGAGTSFAAPFVAGQCALILSLNPGLTKEQVEAIAKQGVSGIYHLPGNEAYEDELGSGRFDGLQTWLATRPATDVLLGDPLDRSLSVRILPNPSSLATDVRIAASAAFSSNADWSIFDASGRVIRTLRSDSRQLTWDGRDARGRMAPAGAYFLGLRGERLSARLIRIR